MNLAQRRDRELYTRPVRQLCLFVLAVLLTTQLALSLYAWSLSEHRFLPELERKARVVGVSLTSKLTRAIAAGIPFKRIEGVPEVFGDILRENSDIAYLVLTDASGRVLHRSGTGAETISPEAYLDTRTEIIHRYETQGFVHVGVDRRLIAGRVKELRYDVGIVLLTSILIAFEVLWFIVTVNFSAPMRQVIGLMTRMASGDFRHRAASDDTRSLAAGLNRIEERINRSFSNIVRQVSESSARAGAAAAVQSLRERYRFAEDGAGHDLVQPRVVAVRILTFLFMFAEMLSRAFLPLYAGTLPDHGLRLSGGLQASLPITAFLLGVALAMPFAGRWSDFVGRRSSYLGGAVMAAVGLASAGLIPDYVVLVLARALTGVGYAIMFMSCQGYVFDTTDARDSAKGLAMFVGAIMVAEICAPAVGGILADRLGYRMVFIIGAVVALIAAGIASAILDNRAARRTAAAARVSVRHLAANPRFVTLSLLSGIPAKFLYSGFLMFLVPVLLSGLGNTKSEIGRYTMLYGLTALMLAPLFARLADRYNAYAPMVGAGGILTGLGLLPVALGAHPNLVMVGIAALGLGQSMSISAQLVLVARTASGEASGTGPVLGVFRLIERLGAAAGPVVTGALVAVYGAQHATLVLGFGALAAALLFALAWFAFGRAAASEVKA